MPTGRHTVVGLREPRWDLFPEGVDLAGVPADAAVAAEVAMGADGRGNG